jgi:putative ATPase
MGKGDGVNDRRKPAPSAPLAERLRPRSIAEVIGQAHLLGPGKPLQRMLASGRPRSMILWGPPGAGKTTLARLLAGAFDCEFIALSAVQAGMAEIRSALAQAGQAAARGRHTILFIDEIHRFGKAQQDALLPTLEAGAATLVGATTENPSFTVNRSLLERAQVHVLTTLADAELRQLAARATGTALAHLHFDDTAVATIVAWSDGDARRCLNLLEQAATAAGAAGLTSIGSEFVESALTLHARRFDKGGDNFYDQISALHKSVRGSHPDAALYWLTRMLDGGVDPRYLLRRMTSMAWDDIGLADPRAIRVVNDAAETWQRLGSPDGHLALAEAAVYLAMAAKSNAGAMAFGQAMAFVKHDGPRPVPRHFAVGAGRVDGTGAGCLPEGMREPGWYAPVPRGLELGIAERMAGLRNKNGLSPG